MPDCQPDQAASIRMSDFDRQHSLVRERIKDGPFNWDGYNLAESGATDPEKIIEHVEGEEDYWRSRYTPGLDGRPGPDRAGYRRSPWRPRIGVSR